MAIPLALLGAASIIGGHAGRIGITNAGMRSFSGQFVQSLPFGAGYSLGTYLGFPKNYTNSNTSNSTTRVYNMTNMPNRRSYYSRYNRRYSRYPSRRRRYAYRRSYRNYRRYY